MNFPFAGIIDREDIPCTPEEHVWEEIEPVTVFLSSICLTQNHIYAQQLFANQKRSPDHDDYLWVGLWNGVYYLYNGHHRAIKAALRGELAMLARVYEF